MRDRHDTTTLGTRTAAVFLFSCKGRAATVAAEDAKHAASIIQEQEKSQSQRRHGTLRAFKGGIRRANMSGVTSERAVSALQCARRGRERMRAVYNELCIGHALAAP